MPVIPSLNAEQQAQLDQFCLYWLQYASETKWRLENPYYPTESVIRSYQGYCPICYVADKLGKNLTGTKLSPWYTKYGTELDSQVRSFIMAAADENITHLDYHEGLKELRAFLLAGAQL